ncbi:DUF3450 domain-containing protein [Puniceicoccaceae bacterium K14]|nr:DUF3450 domain-containing protein [Puniceicoccaceae bacterium K14]
MNGLISLKFRSLITGLAASAIVLVTGFAASLEDARGLVDEWVEVEKLLSEESSNWVAEEAIIVDMIALLKSEKASLAERIESSTDAMSAADTKRSELEEERSEYIEAMGFLGSKIGELEDKVTTLYKRFPKPLQEEVSVPYARIPKPDEETRLSESQRLQAVVAILSQADKFNGGVQMISEIQDVGDGQAEVSILYFGLGGAYFQDEAAKYSGIGYPSDDGWVWETTPEHAQQISDLFAVYSGSAEAEFVQLPVTIQ